MFNLKNLFNKTAKNPVVTFEMANGKTFKAELYPEKAPTRSTTSYPSYKVSFTTG